MCCLIVAWQPPSTASLRLVALTSPSLPTICGRGRWGGGTALERPASLSPTQSGGATGNLSEACRPRLSHRYTPVRRLEPTAPTHTLTHSCHAEMLFGNAPTARWQTVNQSDSSHLVSPVNECLAVSGAVIGWLALSVTVSGKCRSMGGGQRARPVDFWTGDPPQSCTADGRCHRGRRASGRAVEQADGRVATWREPGGCGCKWGPTGDLTRLRADSEIKIWATRDVDSPAVIEQC